MARYDRGRATIITFQRHSLSVDKAAVLRNTSGTSTAQGSCVTRLLIYLFIY